jgi:hypothetical protein
MRHIHSGFLKLTVAASMLLWASIIVTPATAAPVSFNFNGTVLTSLGSEGPALYTALGSPAVLSGSFTFDSASVGPANGSYFNKITAVTVNIGSFTTTLAPPTGSAFNLINIADTTTSFDSYHMQAPIDNVSTVGAFTPFDIQIDFIHGPGLFTGNNNLPSLGSLFNASIHVTFAKNGQFPQILGSVDSMTAVPLPPAVILFGAGLVALIGLGARNWQRAQS